MTEVINAIDFTPLVEAIIALIGGIIARYLVPWLKETKTEKQLSNLKWAVQVAVYAAEKAYGAGHGDEKLAYAEKVLAGYNVKLDTQRLRAMIDAQIKEMEQAEPMALPEVLLLPEATDSDEEGEVGADAGVDSV